MSELGFFSLEDCFELQEKKKNKEIPAENNFNLFTLSNLPELNYSVELAMQRIQRRRVEEFKFKSTSTKILK